MCGIFGTYGVPKAAEMTAIGMHSIQHRAIDYAGIVSAEVGRFIHRECGPGVTRKVFDSHMLNRLHGRSALGHIRYPTVTDDQTRDNVQPVVGSYRGIPFAIAHNGNLTNVDELARHYPRATSLDTELIVRMLEKDATGDIESDIARTMLQLKGSFALGILFPDRLIAVQDPHECRPLSIGQRAEGRYFISSETEAFTPVEARWICDVAAGTLVVIDQGGHRTIKYTEPLLKRCPFEGIYFAHPSGELWGEPVTAFRIRLGEALEQCCPAPGADYVMEVPDSAKFQAIGYSQSGRSGVYMPGIIRSHYAGRSFIAATQAERDEELSGKFAFTRSVFEGKKVVVVDDSVVRGSTLEKLAGKLRWMGAKEIHFRITCPLIKHLCQYGINMRGKDGRLIANDMSVEDMRLMVGADSLQFLPLEVLKEVWPNPDGSCFACMDGRFW